MPQLFRLADQNEIQVTPYKLVDYDSQRIRDRAGILTNWPRHMIDQGFASHISIEWIGFAAGSLTTFCWLPQAIKIIRSGDTKAISLITQGAFTLGCFLWMIFGFAIGSPSITIFNVITTCLAGAITFMKVRLG